jgi:hypothetical protein
LSIHWNGDKIVGCEENVLITTTRGRRLRVQRVVFALLLGSALPSGCVVYEPVPAYYPSPPTYDRAWSAALGALQDAGVGVTSADRGTGVIRGGKDGADVTVTVLRQADGRTRVHFDASGGDPGLTERISQAYERNMGR